MLISLGLFFILFFYCRSTFLKRLFFAFFIASFHFTLSTFISSNFTRVVLFLERVSENGTVVRTILSLVLALIFYAIFRFGSNYWLEKPIKIDKKYVALSLLLILLTFLGFLASNSAYWTKSYFGNVGIDEIDRIAWWVPGNCLVSRVINSLCLYKPENNSGTRRCLLSLMLSHSQAALMSAVLVFLVFARFNLRNACFQDWNKLTCDVRR